MLALPLVGLLALALPAWALWRWRGGWRIAAMVPAALMAFVVLRIVVGVAIDPTSHNLWPFELLMAGGLASVLVLALGLVRTLCGAERARGAAATCSSCLIVGLLVEGRGGEER